MINSYTRCGRATFANIVWNDVISSMMDSIIFVTLSNWSTDWAKIGLFSFFTGDDLHCYFFSFKNLWRKSALGNSSCSIKSMIQTNHFPHYYYYYYCYTQPQPWDPHFFKFHTYHTILSGNVFLSVLLLKIFSNV